MRDKNFKFFRKKFRRVYFNDWCAEVQEALDTCQLVTVHLDSLNHCLQKRTDLQAALSTRGLLARVQIPEDGQTLEFFCL